MSAKKEESLLKLIKNLPRSPGVYKYFNKEGELIYVGKAKSLKNRVSSYFQKDNQHNRKTMRLVAQIAHLEYIVVNSEFDALLLENALIKENQPRYNIQLKDDKSFPFIVITKEPFPRIISVRGEINRKKGDYYGPYINVKAMKVVLDLLHKLFKIRTCQLLLSAENIENKKFKLCLEYHIGNCLAPCEGKQSESDHLENIQQARHLLTGELSKVRSYFKDKIKTYSENLDFERAQEIKEQLDRLEKFQNKSVVSNPKLINLEVFTLSAHESRVYLNFMRVKEGTIIMSRNLQINKNLDEDDGDILTNGVQLIRKETNSDVKEIISNIEFPYPNDDVLITVPKIGDKKKLIDLSLKNVLEFKKERSYDTTRQKEPPTLKILQEDLRLKELPIHIECFDNSNIQGSNPVASMVCFKMGKPSKSNYRHFKIKTVEGPNDFDSMEEIVHRRYKRLLNEDQPLPQLIVIDGGKGQLGAAMKSIKSLGIEKDVAVIGIAKRLEEIYTPGDNDPLMISKKSPSLKLIQQLRNEAHRFAITFHRDLRSKNFINSELEQIPGIGASTQKKLLTKFRTVNGIRNASEQELTDCIGKAKAQVVISYFNNNASSE